MSDDTTTGDAAASPEAKTIPYDRFQQVVAAKNELAGQLEAARAEIGTWQERAANTDTLAGQLRETQGKLQAAEGRFSTFREISSRGLTDPDVVEAVEWQYGRLPEEGRPDMGSWLDGMKADPDTAPAILRPHLFAPEQPAGKPTPKQPAGRVAPPTSGTKPTAEEIRAVRERAQASGNWEEFKELRKRMY